MRALLIRLLRPAVLAIITLELLAKISADSRSNPTPKSEDAA